MNEEYVEIIMDNTQRRAEGIVAAKAKIAEAIVAIHDGCDNYISAERWNAVARLREASFWLAAESPESNRGGPMP